MRYIFVHGLGQNPLIWERTFTYMGETTHFSYPDLFDFLKDKETNYSNLYLGFCEYLKNIPEPVILIGLSLGAVLALNYTIDHPERVQSLVLMAPQYKMPKLLLKFQNIVFRIMPESSFGKIGSSKNDFIQLSKSMMELDFSKDLKKVHCNTLVLCGEKDKANKRAARKLVQQIPNAEMQIVRGVGHEINREDPEQLASLLKRI